ncbi:MAG TPA: hypothetical protein VGN98_04440, partial [Tianweitania sediminis]|nr:hypothetical protein [Tianweitania sediminis]
MKQFARLFSLVLALAVSAGLAAPALAEQFNPVGIWEPDNQESRYQFSICGENSDRLCAELIW